MVDINWSLLADAPNPGNAFLQGLEHGRERKRATEERSVLAEIATKWPSPSGSTGGIVPDPAEDERRFNELITPLAKLNPQMAIKMRQQFYSDRQGQQEAAQKQNEIQQSRILTMGKLINQVVDEPSYQQSLAAARQMGIDVSSAPAQFDPNWVAQQRMIVGAFSKDGGAQISGIARELQDAGYKPGTPEFNEAMRGVIQNKYASDYIDEQGNTRRRSALNLQGGAPASPMTVEQPGQQPGVGFMTFDQFNAMRSVPTFRPGHPAWNTPVRVDQAQYEKLPSGKTFIAPDGSVRIKP